MLAEHVFGDGPCPAWRDLACSTALAEMNTQCQWVAPSIRLVVSSAAMTRATLSLIVAQAAVNVVPARRKALAIAPSEMASPNSSAIDA
jgi:hypothetical protein